jgi:protein-tyrosine-phosphatase
MFAGGPFSQKKGSRPRSVLERRFVCVHPNRPKVNHSKANGFKANRSKERTVHAWAQVNLPKKSDITLSGDPLRGCRILVFGDDTRSFLAVARSLGRWGALVHAAPFDFAAPALRYRHIARVHRLPAYMGSGADWLSELQSLIEREGIRVLLPCDERALLPLARHREAFGDGVALAIPSDPAIEAMFDKVATRQLAQSQGLEVAKAVIPANVADAEAIVSRLGLPVVLKTRRSYTLEKLHSRGKAMVLNDTRRLAAALGSGVPQASFAEAFVPGKGCGLSVLIHDKRLIQAFQHERVHESAHGFLGSYRVSVPVHAGLAEACGRMLVSAGFSGIAMLEFRRRAQDGAFVLLEVNARPWGSLPLPVSLGVDFPADWVSLLLGGHPRPAKPYKTSVFGRNLWLDLQWLREAVPSPRASPLGATRFLAGYLMELAARSLSGREKNDTFVLDDPAPALQEGLDGARQVLQGFKRRLPGAAAWSARRARVKLRKGVLSARAKGGHVLVLCEGNICRSPFAAAVLNNLFGDARQGSGEGIFRSAGTLPLEGRPSPALAVSVARRLGIDLTAHRSKHADLKEIASAQLLIAFDQRNLAALRAIRPAKLPPVVLLGSLQPGDAEIADPIDGGEETFLATYQRILDLASTAKKVISQKQA